MPSPVPAFDAVDRPDPDIVNDCVHCGFCLPTCPTYQLWGQEMDSPRGRIQLIGAALSGAPLDDALVTHLDRCLGCFACVPACPSGVRYDLLLETARGQLERRAPRSWRERAMSGLIFGLFPHPRRLRALRPLLRFAARSGLTARAGSSRRLRRWAPELAALAALAPAPDSSPEVPRFTAARGATRGRAALVTGCVQRALLPRVNAATVRVLTAEGVSVAAPRGQGCCGALALHAGRRDEARRCARALIDTFAGSGADVVVVNAAGCGSAMKGYAELLADDPGYRDAAAAFAASVRDVTEVLADLEPVAERRPLPLTVAYQDACHLASAQGVRSGPRALLDSVPGLLRVELPDPERCCGSAGIYNLVQPGPAAELGARKAADVLASGASLVATGNPGCLLQLTAALREHAGGGGRAAGAPPPVVCHVVELLDAAVNHTALPGVPEPVGSGGALASGE